MAPTLVLVASRPYHRASPKSGWFSAKLWQQEIFERSYYFVGVVGLARVVEDS